MRVCGRSTGSQLSSKPTRPNSRRSRSIRGTTCPPTSARPSGWIRLDLTDHMDWNEVHEILESSYRLTAGPKRVARLDAVKDRIDPGDFWKPREVTVGTDDVQPVFDAHRCQYPRR